MMRYERRSSSRSEQIRHALSNLPRIPADPAFDRDLHLRIDNEGGEIPHLLHSLPSMTAPGNFEEELWKRIGTSAPSHRTPLWIGMIGGWRTLNGLVYLLGGAAALIAVVVLSSHKAPAPQELHTSPTAATIAENLSTHLPLSLQTQAPVMQKQTATTEPSRRAATSALASAVKSSQRGASSTESLKIIQSAPVVVVPPATPPAATVAPPMQTDTAPQGTAQSSTADTHSTKSEVIEEPAASAGGPSGEE